MSCKLFANGVLYLLGIPRVFHKIHILITLFSESYFDNLEIINRTLFLFVVVSIKAYFQKSVNNTYFNQTVNPGYINIQKPVSKISNKLRAYCHIYLLGRKYFKKMASI